MPCVSAVGVATVATFIPRRGASPPGGEHHAKRAASGGIGMCHMGVKMKPLSGHGPL